MTENNASAVVWRRLAYMLTPQLDIYKHLADHLDGKHVLEVGFGTGTGVLQYAARANSIVAIETDAAAVKFAKSTFPVAGVRWEEADITTYRLVAPKFDAVVMVEVLEHIKDWERALRVVHRMLLPGGCFYLSHRNANADLRKNDLHEREWTAEELLEKLLRFFDDVRLFDYTLSKSQSIDTRATPLVAVAKR